MRYRGQRHNIKVPITGLADVAAIRAAFDRDYRRRYGHADARAGVEVQALHLSASSRLHRPDLERLVRARGGGAGERGARPVYFGRAAGRVETRVYDRFALAPGFAAPGPAIIEEYGSTTVVWPGDRFEIGPLGEIRIYCRLLMADTPLRAEARTAALDPVTIEVIRHGIVSIADQIDANITRTAFSPYIYEYKDYAVGMTDADGRLIAQCMGGMPIFVADAVGSAVRDGLRIYGPERLFEGDVIVCNAPSVQGQHLNNTVMYTPIYAGPGQAEPDRLLRHQHALDRHRRRGGRIVLVLLDRHLHGGHPVPHHQDLVEGRDNRRDLSHHRGQHALPAGADGRHRGPARRLFPGPRPDPDACRQIRHRDVPGPRSTPFSTSARRPFARASAPIPDGTYEAESFLDNDGAGDAQVPIKVRVIVAGDEMTVDYSDISPEVAGCINSGYHGGGVTTARIAFMYLIAAGEPANEGTFRPLKLILPEGKIVSARPTAPDGHVRRALSHRSSIPSSRRWRRRFRRA